MKKIELIFGILRVPVDFLMAFAALLAAYLLRPYSDLIPGIHFPVTPDQLPCFAYYLNFAAIAALCLIPFFALSGLYNLKTSLKKWAETIRILIGASAWLMGVIAYYFLIAHQLFFSRILLIHSWLFIILFTFFGRQILRLIQRMFLRFGYGKRTLVFVGTSSKLEILYHALRSDRRFRILGVIDEGTDDSMVLGSFQDIPRLLAGNNIDEVVCLEEAVTQEQMQAIMHLCQEKHIGYRFIPAFTNINFSHLDIDVFDGIPLIKVHPTPLDGWGRVLKRGMDALGSIILLILLSPLFIIIALAIRLESKGPVFYKSLRVGQKGKKNFHMLKFRTMISNADAIKTDLLEDNQREGPLFKIKNDPRITKVGKFLRRFSLDELPQLVNVLKGQISLVGPRAHLPAEVANYKKNHLRVLAIKPGITGMAQVNGRSDLGFEDEVKFDIYYIENWSLLLDIKILLKTIFVVLEGKGAD